MSRSGTTLGLWSASLCSLALLLGCAPELAAEARPDPAWPDLAQPIAATTEAANDAAVIISIEDPTLGGRPGAREVGDAWYRMLHDGMGVQRRRISLLRDEKATRWRVRHAIKRAGRKVRTGGVIWIVYLGPGSTQSPDSPGSLHLPPGRVRPKPLDQLEVLASLATGDHAGALAVFDACLPDSAGGLPAPRLQWKGSILVAVRDMGEDRPHAEAILDRPQDNGAPDLGLAPSDAPKSTLEAIGRQLLQELVVSSVAAWHEPTNVATVSAGTGSRCADSLAGHPYPALGYAALGALRGWADDDPAVSVEELTAYVATLSRLHVPVDGTLPIPQAGGVDIVLRTNASESGPDLTALAPPRTDEELTEIAERVAALPVMTNFEDLVHVPEGSFTIGCVAGDRECEDDEKPAHTESVPSFAIGRHETTWGEYKACVLAGECTPIKLAQCYVWKHGEGFVRGGELDPSAISADRPVICLTWEQAEAVCRFRGRRLPTEMEWERAARGSTHTKYPWGASQPTCKRTNFDGCGSKILPVGSVEADTNPFGLRDVIGNVAEWTADWYDENAYDHPRRGRKGGVRVIRGGSYYAGPSTLRTSYRYGLSPEFGYSTVGVRCAR